uniref:Uncharacterized protein n=1 Tax=Caenorhabditis japonica TaxID=281687 RepID=A0A8R1HUA4_CAEJA
MFSYEKVPAEYVKDIEIVYENCGYNFTCNKRAKPIEAYVLGVSTVKEHYYREFLPLVLAFSKDLKNEKYFCVVADNDNFEKCKVDAYGLAGPKENLTLQHRNTEVIEQLVDKRWTWVEKFFEENNRGGPMIKNISNQTTLIGIGATPAFRDGVSKNFFYNIQAYLTEVCKLTGICNDDDVSTTASTTVTTLTTSNSNQVTGYDQIETVTREPLDDEEKFKPVPNDVKTDRNAWPVMMVNVEDSSNTVYEDEVKELFVSSSFLNGDGDEKKRFVILFALIFYWLWN